MSICWRRAFVGETQTHVKLAYSAKTNRSEHGAGPYEVLWRALWEPAAFLPCQFFGYIQMAREVKWPACFRLSFYHEASGEQAAAHSKSYERCVCNLYGIRRNRRNLYLPRKTAIKPLMYRIRTLFSCPLSRACHRSISYNMLTDSRLATALIELQLVKLDR